jgi:hypothetical protein
MDTEGGRRLRRMFGRLPDLHALPARSSSDLQQLQPAICLAQIHSIARAAAPRGPQKAMKAIVPTNTRDITTATVNDLAW